MKCTFVIAVSVLALALGACGGGDDAADLSPAAQEGLDVAEAAGCMACHRDGGVGANWQGIYGEEVTLDDGSTVIADDAYLIESIKDPQAKVVEGYTVVMPENELTDDEIASILAYIKELK